MVLELIEISIIKLTIRFIMMIIHAKFMNAFGILCILDNQAFQ